MLNSNTYKEEEFVCTELFIDSGPACSGCSSADVRTKGTSRLWLRSNAANTLRNCEEGGISRSWIAVHNDSAPSQSPRRPVPQWLSVLEQKLKYITQAHPLNGEVSCYLPVSGEELRKQVQVSCCHIHKQNVCEYVCNK